MRKVTLSFCNVIGAFFLLFILTGCESSTSNNLPKISELGLVMYAEASRHENQDTAQVIAAVYKDGQPTYLVGGDVFEARTATARILLKDKGSYTGSYAGQLPVDDSIQEIYFNIVHEPIEAREERWYPVDIINIDPGPGELVGKSATVSFPPAVMITGPSMDTVYTSINDVIDLSWVAFGAGDHMRVLSAIQCTDGLAVSTYGTMVELADDDGLETITMDKFIYDLNDALPGLTFITDTALVLLQEILNKLSAGNIDPDYLAKKGSANPIYSNCEIRLFLQRQREGQFDITFDDGTVIGSRTSEVTIKYEPTIQLN